MLTLTVGLPPPLQTRKTHVAEGLQTLHGPDQDLVVQPEAAGRFQAVHAAVRLLNPPQERLEHTGIRHAGALRSLEETGCDVA